MAKINKDDLKIGATFTSCKDCDRVAVVRCKDCKRFLADTDYCRETNQGYCEFDNIIKQRMHYCGYGERKCEE